MLATLNKEGKIRLVGFPTYIPTLVFIEDFGSDHFCTTLPHNMPLWEGVGVDNRQK
ncbi:MAG: hypothetical protein DSM106950_08500 [Stigonema ocellatum SAG 48.90 = DSM 106950]|nr:hypothetical protein [Stigonema ocellatum SAG 48.90 = DSM 106950]